jgi:hypothetical protein
MPQFNGKQEAKAFPAQANLRCPRNGKRKTSLVRVRSIIEATGRA